MGVLRYELVLQSLWVLSGDVGGDEAEVHVLVPPCGVLPPPMVLVCDVSFLELVHDDVVQLHRHLLLGVLGVYLVGEFDESMEVLGLTLVHPVTAVDEGCLDHLELLS